MQPSCSATGRTSWEKVPLTSDDVTDAEQRAREILAKRPERIAALEELGQERALIYKTLVLTALRCGELRSITVAQAHLDGSRPCLELAAADEKSRTGSTIPLREDLAQDLSAWKACALRRLQAEARRRRAPVPVQLAPQAPLLRVPSNLVKVLDRDLKVAGIDKQDDRNRSVDVHSFRHTFATWLSASGIPQRIAQAALRHSDPRLTANVYTDPVLLDVHGALDALPPLAVPGSKEPAAAEVVQAAGDQLAPELAPDADFRGPSRATPGNSGAQHAHAQRTTSTAVSVCVDRSNAT